MAYPKVDAKHASYHAASSPPSAASATGSGTPSTVPTAVSPGSSNAPTDCNATLTEFQLDELKYAREVLAQVNASLLARRTGNLDLDPVQVNQPKFSPTAEEFTPVAIPYCHGTITNTKAGGLQAGDPIPGARCNKVYQTPGHDIKPLIHAIELNPPRGPAHIWYGPFSINEPTGRAFVVTGCSLFTTDFQYIASAYRNFPSLLHIDASLLHEGTFAVEFSDFGDAKQAAALTLRFLFVNQAIKVFKLTPKDLAVKQGQCEEYVSNWQGTYSVGVVTDEPDKMPHAATLSPTLLSNALRTVGNLKAFAQVDHKVYAKANPGLLALYRAEYSDTRANIGSLNGAPYWGDTRIIVVAYKPDVIDPVFHPGNSKRTHPGQLMPAVRRLKDEEHEERVQSFLRQPRSPHVNTNHNVVDILRIISGLDVRTTIMLRNIPNRVDQKTLKELVDETSLGKVDFMYLRIDFANNCNVGYAFINFVMPIDIVAFAEARAGQKWNLFNSDKVAEISYATIQGRDCLIQKFRNSSVMLERGSFRPKLYKTGNGPDAGTEEPFPGPDNQAKLKRSCDNAEHVGLYIPPTRMHTDLPAPRNQIAGGSYVAPASSRRAALVNQPNLAPTPVDSDMITHPGTSTLSPTSLYAPREGQAYRERQRRQQTHFDHGTPGAEYQSRRSFSSVQSSGYLTTATSPDWNKTVSPKSPFYAHSPELAPGHYHDGGRKIPHPPGLVHPTDRAAGPNVPEAPNHFVQRLLGCI